MRDYLIHRRRHFQGTCNDSRSWFLVTMVSVTSKTDLERHVSFSSVGMYVVGWVWVCVRVRERGGNYYITCKHVGFDYLLKRKWFSWQKWLDQFIKLEDVASRFHTLCILDVKVGRRVWDDFAERGEEMSTTGDPGVQNHWNESELEWNISKILFCPQWPSLILLFLFFMYNEVGKGP